MSPSYCTQCGAQLSGPARFCGRCGAPISAGPGAAQPGPAPTFPQADKAVETKSAGGLPFPSPPLPGARPQPPFPSNTAAPQPVSPTPAAVPSFAPPPPVAAGRPASTGKPTVGRGALDSLMTLAPGLAIQLFQNGSAYLANPAAAARFLLPCLISIVSVALAPKLGKWVAVLVILPALGYMLIPLIQGFSADAGASGMVQAHAGRGLVSMSMFYMLMNLLRSRRR